MKSIIKLGKKIKDEITPHHFIWNTFVLSSLMSIMKHKIWIGIWIMWLSLMGLFTWGWAAIFLFALSNRFDILISTDEKTQIVWFIILGALYFVIGYYVYYLTQLRDFKIEKKDISFTRLFEMYEIDKQHQKINIPKIEYQEEKKKYLFAVNLYFMLFIFYGALTILHFKYGII